MKPSPKYLLTMPRCSSSTARTLTRKKSFMISTISPGGDALARAVHERISTNITVISSSTPLNPGSLQDPFRRASAYVQTECLAQFLFVPELVNHLIEFTQQSAKFICTSRACATKIDGQISARNRIGCGAQLIDRFRDQLAYHQRGENSE